MILQETYQIIIFYMVLKYYIPMTFLHFFPNTTMVSLQTTHKFFALLTKHIILMNEVTYIHIIFLTWKYVSKYLLKDIINGTVYGVN